MTKIEMKRKDLDVIEAMIEAVENKMRWDCYHWDADTQENVLDEHHDPELLTFYENWIAKLEKMI